MRLAPAAGRGATPTSVLRGAAANTPVDCRCGEVGASNRATYNVLKGDIIRVLERYLMRESDPVVYVVEDEDSSRALILALASSVGLPCKPFADARAFLDNYNPRQSGCLVLDVFMPGMSGLELQSELNRRGAVIPVIFVTGNAVVPDVVEAMRHGAFNYLVKPIRNADLLDSLHRALDHDRSNRRTLAQLDHIRERILSLTSREREVLELVARGCANKVMAQEMRLSQRTVELHRSRVMEKMGASSIAQLVRMFMDSQHSRSA